jgi:hypothetical protein
MQLVQTFNLFPPIFFDWRLILNFLLVAMLEWEREWPDFGPRPQMSQTLDIYASLKFKVQNSKFKIKVYFRIFTYIYER